ncbi:hypothetical protein [Fimbriiglobus ruber]|uniref:Serine/threonine protein kinase n=1 Tax=Fimbriiglobus ruber TaxID=1908690 RepID=A0A225DV08_9BACT|nr:hypothetical protein [Fimbriiglobus ruber]OWK43484.1 serine/threonine protein kinase [Fimbriiglobus ruber]
MPSDSVSTFLDQARANRLLKPDLVDELFTRMGVPQQDLGAVCDALLEQGVLTRYQADLVRAGKRGDLTFAGYPILDEIGPCSGGTAFKALHPSLRTPLVLRRVRADWVAPADTVGAFIGRAQTAAAVAHPHLAHVLDAGVYRDDIFIALEPFDGGDLRVLVTDIGPMPTALALTYARQIATALRAAHDRGVVHGYVRPACTFAGPLVPMSKPRPDGAPRSRPAPSAATKLFDLGLVPVRPPVAEWAAAGIPADDVAYLPPSGSTRVMRRRPETSTAWVRPSTSSSPAARLTSRPPPPICWPRSDRLPPTHSPLSARTCPRQWSSWSGN